MLCEIRKNNYVNELMYIVYAIVIVIECVSLFTKNAHELNNVNASEE